MDVQDVRDVRDVQDVRDVLTCSRADVRRACMRTCDVAELA